MPLLPPIHLWGIAAALEPVGGGSRNAVVRTSGLKRDLVFKSTRRSEAALLWLGPVMQAAEEAGLSVPHLIPTLDGPLLGSGWTCEPWIEGRPFAPNDIPALAPLIDAFHAATPDTPQRPGCLSSLDFLEATSGGDVDLVAMPADLIVMCRRAWRKAATDAQSERQSGETGEIGVIHGDLNAGNLIHTDRGPALLDWDETRVDVRAFDRLRTRPETATRTEKTAALAWEVASSWTIEPDHARLCARILESRM